MESSCRNRRVCRFNISHTNRHFCLPIFQHHCIVDSFVYFSPKWNGPWFLQKLLLVATPINLHSLRTHLRLKLLYFSHRPLISLLHNQFLTELHHIDNQRELFVTWNTRALPVPSSLLAHEVCMNNPANIESIIQYNMCCRVRRRLYLPSTLFPSKINNPTISSGVQQIALYSTRFNDKQPFSLSIHWHLPQLNIY